MRQFVHLRRNILSVPVVGRPVMHTMEIHTCREQIGMAPHPNRRQIPAIASAPQADAFCVNIAAALKVLARRHHVLILRRATPSTALGFSKRSAVADSAAVIERQYDVS